MRGSLRLGRVLGIEVGVHWSWLFVLLLVVWFLEATLLTDHFSEWTAAQRWAASVLAAVLGFGSVLLHEVSHSLVARRLGLRVRSITLLAFGGVTNLAREPETPRQEFLVAAAGPVTSLLLALSFSVLWITFWRVSEPVGVLAAYLAVVNGMLGVLNLLPGFPLDGGRILRSTIWSVSGNRLQATGVARWAGGLIAFGLVGAGVIVTFTVSLISGFWFILVGWFLWGASGHSYERAKLREVLGGIQVASLLRTSFISVPPTTTPRELVDAYVVPQGLRYFPVIRDGDSELLGLVTLTDIKNVDEGDFDAVMVRDVMTPREKLITSSPDHNAFQALRMMVENNVHQLPVLSGEEIRGFVTRAEIMRELPSDD